MKLENSIYKCPYCNTNKYKKIDKLFESWKSIRIHTGKCKLNTKTYFICEYYGPINVNSFSSIEEFRLKYPNTTLDPTIFAKLRKYNKSNIQHHKKKSWTKEECIIAIKQFVSIHNRIPQRRDFVNSNLKYPSYSTVQKYFNTWNNAITSSGFELNNDGFGIRTKAKDNILYRSSYETKFVNEYLYNKHKYIYEVKYPSPYNRYYDFYLPEWDLYIEIDGNCRPEVIKDKIDINIKLNRNLLVINTENWDNDINEFLMITKE